MKWFCSLDLFEIAARNSNAAVFNIHNIKPKLFKNYLRHKSELETAA